LRHQISTKPQPLIASPGRRFAFPQCRQNTVLCLKSFRINRLAISDPRYSGANPENQKPRDPARGCAGTVLRFNLVSLRSPRPHTKKRPPRP